MYSSKFFYDECSNIPSEPALSNSNAHSKYPRVAAEHRLKSLSIEYKQTARFPALKRARSEISADRNVVRTILENRKGTGAGTVFERRKLRSSWLSSPVLPRTFIILSSTRPKEGRTSTRIAATHPLRPPASRNASKLF